MTYEKDEVDETLLRALRKGGRTPGWLIEHIELPMSTSSAVGHRLKLLAAAGEVQNIGHGIYELPGGYVPVHEASAESPDVEKQNDDLHELVENVDWSNVAIARTDSRVDALVHVLEVLRGNGAMSSSELRDTVRDFNLGIKDSSVQRMLSDVLAQLDEVEGGGSGTQKYRWVG